MVGAESQADTLPYYSIGSALDEATNRSVTNTTTRQVGPAASANHTGIASDALVLSSLLGPIAGIWSFTHFRAELTTTRQTIQRSATPTRAEAYSLLNDNSAPGTFLYAYPAGYPPSKQWLADNESLMQKVGRPARP